jgi:hypothetical protein
MKIQDMEWEVFLCSINGVGDNRFWVARTKETCKFGITHWVFEKTMEESKVHWESFARENGITKWRYA